ncbi:MAG: DUF3795 domain-containing protein [Methanomassiliicoccus sp.]|nr:DUF3795 domain-containing protein [Methanomassiliicoccus sp.]
MFDSTAYCGLNCRECEAYKATRAGDREWKERLVKNWADGRAEHSPEDIECNGCKSTLISGFCRILCLIRPCAMEKGVGTCAECEEYPCGKLKEYLSTDPVAAKNLEKISKGLKTGKS